MARVLALNKELSSLHLYIVCSIVVALLGDLSCIKTMQKYFMFIHKMELGSGSH